MTRPFKEEDLIICYDLIQASNLKQTEIKIFVAQCVSDAAAVQTLFNAHSPYSRAFCKIEPVIYSLFG